MRQVAIGTQHVIVLTDEGVEKPAEADEELKMEVDEPVEAKEDPIPAPEEDAIVEPA